MSNMLGELLKKIVLLSSEMLGPLYNLTEKLLGSNRMWWLNALNKFLRKENPFVVEAGEVDKHFELKEMWKRIYKKHFRMKLNFADLHIPECPGAVSDYWLVIVAKGMLPEKIFLACKKAFDAWKWTDKNFDEIVKSVRNAKGGSYAIWVRANVEADEEFKNLSANQLEECGHKGITLEERMLLEIMYFEQTGKHLDIQNITLCAGSQYSVGFIPRVGWFGDGLSVDWYSPVHARGHLRSRQVSC